MEQPATTNSTPTRRTRASTAMLDQLRGELATARTALDSERGAVRALQRDRAAEVKAVRVEEARKFRDSLSDLKSRLERDHEDALQRQKDAVTKTLNAGVLRALKEKDAETRQELAEAHAREDALKVQVRDAVRTCLDAGPIFQQQRGASSGDIQKLQQEVTALRLHNKQLEERLQVVMEADRQKASDLRSQHEEHEMQLIQLKKSSQQETHRLLEELKSKERTISQLERELILQTGRVEEQRERLLERQHEPHPRESECSEDNCARGRVRLVQRLAELQASMKKAVETHAQDKKEMIRKLRELEGKSQSSRQSQKNSKRNNRPATRETVELDNVESGMESDESHQTGQELEKLRADIEERDRTIAELRQAAKEKDRKLDHPTNRHRKEQMRQYYRQFMELEPVAELEEDSGAGEDSPTSSGSPSLSPQPYIGDIWSELSNNEYHDTLYSCLLKEHLDLQREYQFLQTRLKRELAQPNRIRLRLEHELAISRTHVRELKRTLSEQKGRGAVLTEKIAALQTEAHDLREQNELLEFRILELEECHENSSVKSQGPDTRDVWTDTESDDVSDSGVQSLPSSEDTSSDVDLGIHDIKMEIRNEELKGRLLKLAKTSCNTADRCCLQQVLALLESYETRLEELQDDGSYSTVIPDSPSARGSLDTGGRAPRNLSESATASINDSSKFTSRIIATVLPFTDQSLDTNKDTRDASTEGDEFKKQLKNAECLQESGIFEDTEYNSQGTQTESVTAEPLIRELKSPFETCVVGVLSAEIQKLTQFRERVEEAGNGCGNKKLLRVDEGRGDEPPPHRKELEYCRERLKVLEDKVRVYESSGELQVRLLAERLQKEVRLSAQVKELSAKVEQLVAENRRLDEEKCEFEEAENDTRLKCQKLEVKLVSLSEKKSDLQAQLQQERRNMSRVRSSLSESERKKQEAKGQLNYLEVMLNKYEQRNYELEEREVDLKHRLEMLENSMPALLMWNMWRLVQDTGVSRADVTAAVSNTLVRSGGSGERRGKTRPSGRQKSRPSTSPELGRVCPPCTAREDPSRMREIEEDRQRILTERREAEKAWQATEKQLRSRLQVLEAQAGPVNSEIQGYKEAEDKYKKRIRELENELYGTKGGSQEPGVSKVFESASEKETEPERSLNQLTDVPSISCGDVECMKKLQELVQSEVDMKKRVTELERKEKAYMETLQQADELWSEMETSYKKRISTAEVSEASMRDKVKKLEESETKLRQAYHHDDENEMLLEKLQNMEMSEKTFTEKIRALETERNQLFEETTQLRDALQSVQTELNKTKEMVAGPLKEELQKERKLSKTLKDEISTIEQDMRDKSSTQQSQINGLKVQLKNTSRDLVDLECTNGELKEEVDTLEAKVSELKTVIEQQKQHEEKLIIRMSQTILEKEQELDEAKREMRYSQTPNAREELNQVLQDIGGDAVIEASAALELPEVQTSKAGGEPMETPEDKRLSTEEPEKPKEVTQQPSEAVPTKPCGCRCICGAEQPPPVSALSQKPVLRRWLLPQKVNPKKDWDHWRQC